MKGLLFGTAGTPHSSRARSTVSGVERIKELGLGCMEVEFVRGVKMGEETAGKVNKIAGRLDIALSVHAPYYINLNSPDREVVKASIDRITQSARIGSICGAMDIVFHPAFYMKSQKRAVYSRVKTAVKEIQRKLKDEGIEVVLRPETTGKRSQFGSLDELVALGAEVDGVLPCVDFSHVHARDGRSNTPEEFRSILSQLEGGLGRTALEDMHIHVSGIVYNRKGERNHVNLNESDLRYHELLEVWKEFGIKGTVICESPNLEGDAILLWDAYRGISMYH